MGKPLLEHFLFYRHPSAQGPSKKALALVFILSLCLRWLFLFFWGGLLFPDATGRYLPVSEELFTHWSGTVYDTPGYPVFLALSARSVGAGTATLYVQGLIDSLSVIMIFDIAARILRPGPALKIAIFFAIHFGAIAFAAAILSETLFTFFVVTAIWRFARLGDSAHWLKWGLPGIALGFAALTRANGVATIPAFALSLGLCHTARYRWRRLAAFLIAAALPVAGWVQFNARINGVRAIAQGGGWQWLQNLAYFDLVQPGTLPPPHDRTYRDWTSLTRLRQDMMARHRAHPGKVDPMLGALARENAAARPLAYLLKLPAAWLLPRRFVKDMTAMALQVTAAGNQAEPATEKYAHWQSDRHPPAMLTLGYRLLRSLTVLPYKYSLLIAALPALLWVAWRRRDGWLLTLTLLPLSQALPLLLLLNPIERYYFPFESLMIIALFRGFLLRRGSIAAPHGQPPTSQRSIG